MGDGKAWAAACALSALASMGCGAEAEESADVRAASCATEAAWSQAVVSTGPFDDVVWDVDVDASCRVAMAATVSHRLDDTYSDDALRVAVMDALGRPVHSRELLVQHGRAFAAFDGEGALVVATSFEGSVDFGGGPLDSAGAHDVLVVKLAPDGSHLWSKRFGNTGDDRVGGLAVGADGAIAVAGRFDASIDLGGGALDSAGNMDAFVAVFEADGSHRFSRRFGSDHADSDEEQVTGVALAPDGSVALIGRALGSIDFGGGALPSTAGYTGFVALLDAAGEHIFSLGLDGGEPQAVVADAAGIVVGGNGVAAEITSEVGSMFVLSLDRAGAPRMSAALGTEHRTVLSALTLDPEGNIVLGGAAGEPLDLGGGALPFVQDDDGNEDLFVAAFAADGEHLYSEAFGEGEVLALAADAAGRVVAGGYLVERATFGGDTYTTGDSVFGDGFLARWSAR